MQNNDGLRLAEIVTIGVLIFSVLLATKSSDKLAEIAENTKK